MSRRIALVAAVAGLLVALVPPWVEERPVAGGHPFDRRVVSRGYAFVGAILLVLLVPSGGFVGSGHTGVGAGGPAVILFLVLLIGLLAGAIFAFLTLFLLRVLHMDVPWRLSSGRLSKVGE